MVETSEASPSARPAIVGAPATVVDAPGRAGVMEAAAHRFVAAGYAATTLRQIADDLGIKAASIYHHFDSKQALFVAVLDEGIRVMHAAFDGVAAPESQRPDQRDLTVLAYVRAHLGALFEHGPYTAAHVTAFFTAPPEVRAQVVPTRDRYERRWNDLLGDVLPDRPLADRALLRLVLFGAMNATIEWFDPDQSINLDELAGTITDQFLHGVST